MHEYFPPDDAGCPTFVDDSEWHPLVDGADYFAELDRLIAELGVGDAILIGGLEIDGDVDLTGTQPGQEGYAALPDRLVAAGAAGADVRVLLAGKVVASFLPIPGLGNFRANRALVQQLDQARPKGWPTDRPPPLQGHVLVDYSGVLLGSNHQKTVVVTQGGVVTAFIGGIDLVASRIDAAPHDRLTLHGRRWGWHDMAVRLRGPAAARAHDVFLSRWHEAATLPPRPYLAPRRPLPRINPAAQPAPPPAIEQPLVPNPGTSVRVLRSISDRKLDSLFPWRRFAWDALPSHGVQEVFQTLVTAIGAARRYVYIEDQYLSEYAAGRRTRFELYPSLRDAAARGVKVILLGSGVRDPEDPGFNLQPINRKVNRDLRTKILDALDDDRRGNVVFYRLEHATVHSKLALIDDTFANIGSANLFSRSMAGVDCEISAAVVTSTSSVRDLRVQVWGEHLRAPLTPQLRASLDDLDLALAMWHPAWLPARHPAGTWRVPGEPAGFLPAETVLTRFDA